MPQKVTKKQEQEKHARRKRAMMLTVAGVCAVLGVVACSYGYAAVSSDLLISGEATVRSSGGLLGITYMQDMTPSVCEASGVGDTKRLTDSRDGKQYWVAKLADGKCWMTQNLALDITPEGLTSELSDINASTTANYEEEVNDQGETIYKWNENSKNPPNAPVVDAAFTSSSSTANDVVCKSSKTTADFVIAQPAVVATSATLAKIEDYGDVVKDVTGWEPSYQYDSSKSSYSYDETNKTYDAHYLIGDYYSAGAAMAGSTAASPRVATSSICPKGWRLAGGNNTPTSDFAKLLTAYGITSKTAYTLNGVTRDVAEPPLYFARYGVNGNSTKYTYVGTRGTFWSNYTTSTHYRAGLQVSSSTLNALTEMAAHPGRTVRCMARTE